MLSDGSKLPAIALAPLALMPRAATISWVKFETEVEARVEAGGDAMTYVVEVLAFVKRLLAELEEVVALLDNISSMEEEGEDDVQGEEEQGAFSSFSTSLCSLEVSDVGVEVAMEEGREDGVVVVGPGTLGNEEKGKES